MNSPSPPSGPRSGFSLLELMVVRAVVATILAVAWPMLRHRLGRSVVQDAAQQVAVTLRAARLTAIERGATQQWRYQPGESKYESGPPGNDDDHFARHRQIRGARQRETVAEIALTRDADVVVDPFLLPDSVTFYNPAAVTTYESRAAVRHPDRAAQVVWSSPILFFPDGRSSGGSVGVQGTDGRRVAVRVRALTGGIEVFLDARSHTNPAGGELSTSEF